MQDLAKAVDAYLYAQEQLTQTKNNIFKRIELNLSKDPIMDDLRDNIKNYELIDHPKDGLLLVLFGYDIHYSVNLLLAALARDGELNFNAFQKSRIVLTSFPV